MLRLYLTFFSPSQSLLGFFRNPDVFAELDEHPSHRRVCAYSHARYIAYGGDAPTLLGPYSFAYMSYPAAASLSRPRIALFTTEEKRRISGSALR